LEGRSKHVCSSLSKLNLGKSDNSGMYINLNQSKSLIYPNLKRDQTGL